MRMPNAIAIDDFRAAAREGRRLAPGSTITRLATSDPQPVRDAERTLRFTFSDASVDRAGDKISQDGWVLDAFRKNPVVLWAHDSRVPPIGRASNISVQNGRLAGDVSFAPEGTHTLADTVYQLTKLGFINATSVGFLPLEWGWSTDKARPGGIDFTKQELVEISVVPVPCNANALVAARSKGIDTGPIAEWAQRMLGRGAGTMKAGRVLSAKNEADLRNAITLIQGVLEQVDSEKAITRLREAREIQHQARQRLLQSALEGGGPEAVEARRRFAKAKAQAWRARQRFAGGL